MKNWMQNKRKELEGLSLFELWLRWDRLGLIIGLPVIIGIFLIGTFGSVKSVDQTLPACVITADGKILSTNVRIEGELTVHPYDPFGSVDTFESDAGEGIFINGIPVAYDIHFFREDSEYVYRKNDQPSYRAEYVVKRECEEFVFCMDLSLIFPERESQLCLVVAPAGDEAEAKVILELIPKDGLSEEFAEVLSLVISK